MEFSLSASLFWFAAGILALVWSGGVVVRSLTRISVFLGVSTFFTSFVLMAFATTLPEFGVGVSAALSGNPTLALGNVFGTNIVNLTLIIGLVALIGGGIRLDSRGAAFFSYSKWFDVVLIFSPIALLIDGVLSRAEGGLLLGLFLFHMIRIFMAKEFLSYSHPFMEEASSPRAGTLHFFVRDMGIFMGSVALLLGSSFVVVESAHFLGLSLGIPQILLGLFVVALGTSLPELVFGIRSALLKSGGASLGNLLGAAVLNSTWVLGVTALIHPIVLSVPALFFASALFVILSVGVVVFFLRSQNRLGVREALILIGVYVLFVAFQTIVEFLL